MITISSDVGWLEEEGENKIEHKVIVFRYSGEIFIRLIIFEVVENSLKMGCVLIYSIIRFIVSWRES